MEQAYPQRKRHKEERKIKAREKVCKLQEAKGSK